MNQVDEFASSSTHQSKRKLYCDAFTPSCRREQEVTDEEERYEYNGDGEEVDSDSEITAIQHNTLQLPLRLVHLQNHVLAEINLECPYQ